MSERVTIQDIADALGLSRNTVSKAINNTGVLADATREKVLQKAIEMGYKQFSYASISNMNLGASQAQPKHGGEFALFTGMFLGNSHFSSTMLDKFQMEISLLGYSMTMHRVTQENIEEMTLPITYNPERTKGILCIEIFDLNYCQMLCGLNIPILMVDGPSSAYVKKLNADLLVMNNSSGIFELITNMKRKGIKRIGFIGQPTHCISFFERYLAFRNAMFLNSLPILEEDCLTEVHPHGMEYSSYLNEAIKNMHSLPELFICANDFVAIDTIQALKLCGYSCPEDIKICGFDDSPESKIMSPSLTTIHIHTQIMGYSAANLLVSRINHPELNSRIVYTETSLIYRESTK